MNYTSGDKQTATKKKFKMAEQIYENLLKQIERLLYNNIIKG